MVSYIFVNKHNKIKKIKKTNMGNNGHNSHNPAVAALAVLATTAIQIIPTQTWPLASQVYINNVNNDQQQRELMLGIAL